MISLAVFAEGLDVLPGLSLAMAVPPSSAELTARYERLRAEVVATATRPWKVERSGQALVNLNRLDRQSAAMIAAWLDAAKRTHYSLSTELHDAQIRAIDTDQWCLLKRSPGDRADNYELTEFGAQVAAHTRALATSLWRELAMALDRIHLDPNNLHVNAAIHQKLVAAAKSSDLRGPEAPRPPGGEGVKGSAPLDA